MRRAGIVRALVVGLACCNLVLPVQHLAAAEGKRKLAAQKVPDLKLGAKGELGGEVRNSAGRPEAKAQVAIVRQGKLVAQTTTDKNGRFAVEGMKGGVYHIAGGNGLVTCRVWTERAAPPTAKRDVLIVSGPVERGQQPLANLLCNPIVIGLIVAAAIAIPIIVHNSNDDAS